MQAQYMVLEERYMKELTGMCAEHTQISVLIPAKPGMEMTEPGIFMRNGKVKQPPVRQGVVAVREPWMRDDSTGGIYYKADDPDRFPVWYHPVALKPKDIRFWLRVDTVTLWLQEDGSPFWKIDMTRVSRPARKSSVTSKMRQLRIRKNIPECPEEKVLKTPGKHWLVEDYSARQEDRMECFMSGTLNSMVKALFKIRECNEGSEHKLTDAAYTVYRRKRWETFLSGHRVVFRDEASAKTACLMHALQHGGETAGKLRELVRCWFTEIYGGTV